jgi:hypothetical protein
MQKVSTAYINVDYTGLDYKMVHKNISDKWEKKARDLQKRRWRLIKRQERFNKARVYV